MLRYVRSRCWGRCWGGRGLRSGLRGRSRDATGSTERFNVSQQVRRKLGQLFLGRDNKPNLFHAQVRPGSGRRLNGSPSDPPVHGAVGLDLDDAMAFGRVRKFTIGGCPWRTGTKQLLRIVGQVYPDVEAVELSHEGVHDGGVSVIDGSKRLNAPLAVKPKKEISQVDSGVSSTCKPQILINGLLVCNNR